MNDIEKSILKTITYFDIFSRPLKEKEIFENLQKINDRKEASFFKFKQILQNLELKKNIENKDNLYFLKGEKNIIEKRKNREETSERNWQKLEKIAKKINWTPFLKGVFVSGSLAINNSNEKSDIDLMIITKKGRIFMVRFFLTLILDFIGERRTPQKIVGKICLNHYLVEKSLKVKFPSLYNAYTYLHLKPIINREEVFEKFRKENNWMQDYLLFWDKTFEPPFKIENKSTTAKFLEKILSGNFGNWLEKKFKESQLKRKKEHYPEEIKKGRVILEDNLIELHPDSPEEEILQKYQKRLNKLL
jgi:predicted nucleotidyltransferase